MNRRLRRIALEITKYKRYLYLKAVGKSDGGKIKVRREKSDLE